MKMRFLAGLLLLPVSLLATEPAWWTTWNVKTTDTANNSGPLLQGQLKAMAKAARLELEAKLPYGCSPEIKALIDAFVAANTPPNPSNTSLANVGQLKAVSRPFYDWLLAMGYDTKQNLINHGAPGWAYDYPWTTVVPADGSNYSPATLGQLKWVFSFDLTGFTPTYQDRDADGVFDWYEYKNYGNKLTANSDSDGDGLKDYEELKLGTNPNSVDVIIIPPATGSISLEVFNPRQI